MDKVVAGQDPKVATRYRVIAIEPRAKQEKSRTENKKSQRISADLRK